jgi:hypothetical protein
VWRFHRRRDRGPLLLQEFLGEAATPLIKGKWGNLGVYDVTIKSPGMIEWE